MKIYLNCLSGESARVTGYQPQGEGVIDFFYYIEHALLTEKIPKISPSLGLILLLAVDLRGSLLD